MRATVWRPLQRPLWSTWRPRTHAIVAAVRSRGSPRERPGTPRQLFPS